MRTLSLYLLPLMCTALLPVVAQSQSLADERVQAPTLPAQNRFERRPPVYLVSRNEHGGDWVAHDFAQDARGFLYVANSWGILEFDGVRWNRLTTGPLTRTVFTLTSDSEGVVWYGASGDLGWIEVDEFGQAHLRSLLSESGRDYRSFDIIWTVVEQAGIIYFGADLAVYQWDGRELTSAIDSTGLRLLGTADQMVIAQSGQDGLVRIEGKSTREIEIGTSGQLPGLGTWETTSKPATIEKFCCVVDLPGDGFLLGTSDGRVLEVRSGTARPFPTEVDPYLRANGLRAIERLANGSLALATVYGGVMLLDRDGNVTMSLDIGSYPEITSGTLSLFEDTLGGLWLGTENGPLRVSLDSQQNLVRTGPDELHDLVIREGEVILSTANGLKVLGKDQLSFTGEAVNGTSLMEVEGQLLLKSEGWLYRVVDNHVERLPWNTDCLYGSEWRPETVLICPRAGGIARLGYDLPTDSWIVTGSWPPLDQGIIDMAESSDGWIWVVGSRNSVIRLSGSESDSTRIWAQGEDFTPRIRGVEAGLDRVWFMSDAGVLKFEPDERNASGISERADSGTQEPPTSTEHFTPDRTLPANGKDAMEIVRVSNEEIMVRRRNGYTAVHQKSGELIWEEEVLPETRFVAMFAAEHESEVTHYWSAQGTSVFRYDRSLAARPPDPVPEPFIRSIIANDSVAYPVAERVTLPPERNSVTISFSVPLFTREVAAIPLASTSRYRFRLHPLFPEWSAWGYDAQQAFPRLPPDQYTFEVQAIGTSGVVSPVRSVHLSVEPWWYQSALVQVGGLFFLVMFSVAGAVLWTRRRTHQLEQRGAEMERIIHERTGTIRDQNRELEEQATRLTELDATKSRFFANISHEIRTPLMLALGPLDSALHGAWGELDARARKAVDRGRRNGIQVVRLVDQLLDLSRLEAGVVQLHPERVELAGFLKKMAALFESYAEQFDVTMQLEGLEVPFVLGIDTEKVEKIVINLLSNALKFTPSGGKVVLALYHPNSEEARITVSDTGIGIPEDQQENIFERYRQLNMGAVNPRGQYGVGIGLSLVKELALLHGGTIRVGSSPGKGSTFEVTIRGQEVGGLEGIATPEVDDHTFTFMSGLNREPGASDDANTVPVSANTIVSAKADSSATPSSEPASPVPRATILIVDDNPDMRAYIRDDLQEGYELEEANDGQEALEHALDSSPDIIVSDVTMPVMDGFELCRRLKSDARTSHIPVILLTARTGDESRIEGIEVGADAHLEKPFNTRELLARIRMLLEQRERLRGLLLSGDDRKAGEKALPVIEQQFLGDLRSGIEAGMADPGFTVDLLADELAMSRRQLYRKVEALLGDTPNGLVRRMRVEKARLLLEEGRSVKEAGHAVGFKSLSGFRKAFREIIGATPSEVDE